MCAIYLCNRILVESMVCPARNDFQSEWVTALLCAIVRTIWAFRYLNANRSGEKMHHYAAKTVDENYSGDVESLLIKIQDGSVLQFLFSLVLVGVKVKDILFICSRNQWRSPTAETIWRRHPEFNVKSAGTSPRAKKTVGAADIQWVDMIFVMEQKHKNRLKAEFSRILLHKRLYVLDIPDEYQYMDTALIGELEASVGPYLES